MFLVSKIKWCYLNFLDLFPNTHMLGAIWGFTVLRLQYVNLTRGLPVRIKAAAVWKSQKTNDSWLNLKQITDVWGLLYNMVPSHTSVCQRLHHKDTCTTQEPVRYLGRGEVTQRATVSVSVCQRLPIFHQSNWKRMYRMRREITNRLGVTSGV